jgi:hypothetical protein
MADGGPATGQTSRGPLAATVRTWWGDPGAIGLNNALPGRSIGVTREVVTSQRAFSTGENRLGLSSRHVIVVACLSTVIVPGFGTRQHLRAQEILSDAPSLARAQQLFYNARYEEAAAAALALRGSPTEELAAYELRTSALHFQIKRALGDRPDKSKALADCGRCAALLSAFAADTEQGQALARARLMANPTDEAAMFLLGKIDLNYVWLHLGTLGRKTGWGEYWEARRSLDTVLEKNPAHVRARVARAWMDYIVGTRVPRGTRWLLGGGNKKKGMSVVQETANIDTDFYVEAEARFALWEMLIRERRIAEAIVEAKELREIFPENQDVIKFLEVQTATARP